jgi:hypothetical protein
LCRKFFLQSADIAKFSNKNYVFDLNDQEARGPAVGLYCSLRRHGFREVLALVKRRRRGDNGKKGAHRIGAGVSGRPEDHRTSWSRFTLKKFNGSNNQMTEACGKCGD